VATAKSFGRHTGKRDHRAGQPNPDAWWVVADDGSTGLCMPDSTTDWIEEIANEETPAAP
jgi:hypothetical protein